LTRVQVRPELLHWASNRAGKSIDALAQKFHALDQWLTGEVGPTVKQLEDFAKATRTPFGFFFLERPPVEEIPIPDFRTVGSERVERLSPDLLDTIYICQQRQDWYRQSSLVQGDEPLGFIRSATADSDIVSTAAEIRRTVEFDLESRREARTFEEALRLMLDAADHAGILVMVSGVVGHNTHRVLDTGEFRGFVLSDDLAPLIFINGADTKSGQMFTLAHELAHLWVGASGLFDSTPASPPPAHAATERWCNAVAGEVLVPLENFRHEYRRTAELKDEMRRLGRYYKVSTLVILRRMLDAGGLSRIEFQTAFDEELAHLKAVLAKQRQSGGGDYYLTTKARVSERFARAVLAATWEGRSTFTEAFRLLGCRNVSTLERLGTELGMTEYLRGGPV